VLTSYAGAEVEQYLRGGKAFFISGDALQIKDGVSWWRKKDQKHGKVQARTALVYLKGDASETYLLDGTLSRIIFNGEVDAGLNNMALHTESAEYLAETNVLRGLAKVTMTFDRDIISGDHGFTLNLSDESYEIFGAVNGVMIR
jgi:hypothetical protein